MYTSARSAFAIAVGLGVPVLAIAACGDRTGLLVPEYLVVEPDGATVVFHPFPTEDANVPFDDVSLPPIDSTPQRDTSNPICADASDTLVYAVTESNRLLRFDPPSGQFTTIGTINCPDPLGRSPFSMAVDRFGVAYVLYAQFQDPSPGSIFRVSLATASCEASQFVPGQDSFNSFGMAFSANDIGTGETLYVASDDTANGRLGAIDETSLVLSEVGSFFPAAPAAELSGTADGRLFAFFAPQGQGSSGMTIAQIDKKTAALTAQNFLPNVNEGDAWAFAFWGGDFYLFTAPNDSSSIVTRYDPGSGALAQVASWPERIVGAGVSTCAPAR